MPIQVSTTKQPETVAPEPDEVKAVTEDASEDEQDVLAEDESGKSPYPPIDYEDIIRYVVSQRRAGVEEIKTDDLARHLDWPMFTDDEDANRKARSNLRSRYNVLKNGNTAREIEGLGALMPPLDQLPRGGSKRRIDMDKFRQMLEAAE